MDTKAKQWIRPTVSEFDIAERTQADPFSGDDFGDLGREPDQNGGGNGGGNGGLNGGAPGS